MNDTDDRRSLRGRARDAEAYERFQQVAEWPMLLLSVVFAVVLVLPYVVDLGATARTALNITVAVIWAAFVFEYLALLYLAPDRGHMVRTHKLDLAIILLPFLRPLRALRLLRLLTLVSRAGVAFRRISTRPGFRGFLLVALGVIVAGAGLLFVFEQDEPGANIDSFGDAMWWALVTSTTVGYGDHFPVTTEGRSVAVVLMLIGIGVFGVVTANIAAYFVEESDGDIAEVKERLARIERLLEHQADAAEHGDTPARRTEG